MFRVRIDAIVIECDSADEVRQLVGVLQLPIERRSVESRIMLPHGFVIVPHDGSAISETTPPAGTRPLKARSQREQRAQALRSKIVAFVKAHAGPVHRSAILSACVAPEHDKTAVNNGLARLVALNKVRHSGTFGFYEPTPNGDGDTNVCLAPVLMKHAKE